MEKFHSNRKISSFATLSSAKVTISLWRHSILMVHPRTHLKSGLTSFIWRQHSKIPHKRKKKWLDFFSKDDAGSSPGNRIFFKLTILGLKYVLWIFFQKWRSSEKSHINSFYLDIWQTWRQRYDVIACIGSLLDGVSI